MILPLGNSGAPTSYSASDGMGEEEEDWNSWSFEWSEARHSAREAARATRTSEMAFRAASWWATRESREERPDFWTPRPKDHHRRRAWLFSTHATDSVDKSGIPRHWLNRRRQSSVSFRSVGRPADGAVSDPAVGGIGDGNVWKEWSFHDRCVSP